MRPALRRLLRRGPWEAGATLLIALGTLMLVQPFSKWAYAHGFVVLLAGALGYVVVSKLPER